MVLLSRHSTSANGGAVNPGDENQAGDDQDQAGDDQGDVAGDDQGDDAGDD